MTSIHTSRELFANVVDMVLIAFKPDAGGSHQTDHGQPPLPDTPLPPLPHAVDLIGNVPHLLVDAGMYNIGPSSALFPQKKIMLLDSFRNNELLVLLGDPATFDVPSKRASVVPKGIPVRSIVFPGPCTTTADRTATDLAEAALIPRGPWHRNPCVCDPRVPRDTSLTRDLQGAPTSVHPHNCLDAHHQQVSRAPSSPLQPRDHLARRTDSRRSHRLFEGVPSPGLAPARPLRRGPSRLSRSNRR